MGEDGYLVTHQHCLRKLSLTTEIDCVSGELPLDRFTTLQELSWRGLVQDCVIVECFLISHHDRLISLEIDFVSWTEVECYHDLDTDDDDDDDDDDAYQDDWSPLIYVIMPDLGGKYKDFMPNLQSLSLSAASFKGSWDNLLDAINLCRVKELRLRNSRQVEELLHHAARSGKRFDATRVELVLREAESHKMRHDPVDFLAPFNHLEDLFLMLESDWADRCYTASILRHRSSLRTLIYHRRHYCMVENSPYYEEYQDSPLEHTKGGNFVDVLHGTMLKTLGVCDDPSMLRENLQQVAPTMDSLRLLHLRFTGKVERKPKFFNEQDTYEGDPFHEDDWARACVEARQDEFALPRISPPPTELEFRARWEKIQGENWREDEEKDLAAFADWAFSRDGFPRLQILASGDFSYGDRFASSQTLWCRKAGASSGQRPWRTVEKGDTPELELIDDNMDMLSACPVSPLFYRYGRGNAFPGIS